MTRVEWTRLNGDDVEAVVAMFVNREHQNSVRITPSIGDGGVDILDPGVGPGGTDDVYQVKRFTGPLTASQKKKIESSLKRLTTDERWSSMRLGTWRLVTPWDPTPEGYRWLRCLADEHGVVAVWHGLSYVDQLAAKYGDVVDYYLQGGATRMAEAYQTIMALDQLGSGEDALAVPDIVAKIEKAIPALETDPHYRYEIRTGYGEPAASLQEPGLVYTWITGRVTEGRWTAVDVFERCAMSRILRPITLTGKFTVSKDDPFAGTLQDFFDFGVPFTSPEGIYDGELTAPGGLGGRIKGGVLSAATGRGQVGDTPELHLEALAPSGDVLASVDLVRVEQSAGEAGVRVVFKEANGAFTMEDRYAFKGGGSRTIQLSEFAGIPVTAAHSSIKFLSCCAPPNTGRLSVMHTPAEKGVIDPNLGFVWPTDVADYISTMLDVLTDLLVIQENTATLVRVPATHDVTQQAGGWRTVARILRGEEVNGTYAEDQQLLLQLERELSDSELRHSVAVSAPLSTKVGSDIFDLGRVGVVLENPTLLNRVRHGGTVVHAMTTPDRSFRYVRSAAD